MADEKAVDAGKGVPQTDMEFMEYIRGVYEERGTVNFRSTVFSPDGTHLSTPLIWAVRYNCAASVVYILGPHCDGAADYPDLRYGVNNDGLIVEVRDTALYKACKWRRPKRLSNVIFRELVMRGANIHFHGNVGLRTTEVPAGTVLQVMQVHAPDASEDTPVARWDRLRRYDKTYQKQTKKAKLLFCCGDMLNMMKVVRPVDETKEAKLKNLAQRAAELKVQMTTLSDEKNQSELRSLRDERRRIVDEYYSLKRYRYSALAQFWGHPHLDPNILKCELFKMF